MSISKGFIPNFCMFSQIKDRNYNEQNFHSVARVKHRRWTGVLGGVKNLSVGIFDGAPSNARSVSRCLHSGCLHYL